MNGRQRAALVTLFQRGADEAAAALSRWIGRPAAFSVQSFFSLRPWLRETTACAASRIVWVER